MLSVSGINQNSCERI